MKQKSLKNKNVIKLNNRKQSSVEAERLIKENGFDIKTNAFELQKIYELGGR